MPRERVQEHMPQERMVDLVIVVFLGQKEGWDSHRAGADQRHLDRFERIGVSEEYGQQRQHYRKHGLDQEHGRRCADIVHNRRP